MNTDQTGTDGSSANTQDRTPTPKTKQPSPDTTADPGDKEEAAISKEPSKGLLGDVYVALVTGIAALFVGGAGLFLLDIFGVSRSSDGLECFHDGGFLAIVPDTARLAFNVLVFLGIFWPLLVMFLRTAMLSGPVGEIVTDGFKNLTNSSSGKGDPEEPTLGATGGTLSGGFRVAMIAAVTVSGAVAGTGHLVVNRINRSITNLEAKIQKTETHLTEYTDLQHRNLGQKIGAISRELDGLENRYGQLVGALETAANSLPSSIANGSITIATAIDGTRVDIGDSLASAGDRIGSPIGQQADALSKINSTIGDFLSHERGFRGELKTLRETAESELEIAETRKQMAFDEWTIAQELSSRGFRNQIVDSFTGFNSNRIRSYRCNLEELIDRLRLIDKANGCIVKAPTFETTLPGSSDNDNMPPLCRLSVSDISNGWTRIEILPLASALTKSQRKKSLKQTKQLLHRLDEEFGY